MTDQSNANTPLADELLAEVRGKPSLLTRLRLTPLEAIAIGAIFVVLVAILLPANRSAGGAARRSQCKNNLHDLANAVWHHLDTFKEAPAAAGRKSGGYPVSWRVRVLPFVTQWDRERAELYASYDESKRWDHATNARLTNSRPDQYACPSDGRLMPTQTNYIAPTGPHAVWKRETGFAETDVPDGTSSTILILEQHAVRPVWTSPVDLQILDTPDPATLITSAHREGTQVAMVDGTARFLSAAMDASVLKALLSPNGGDDPGEF